MSDLLIGFDYETHRLGPELLRPPAVCLSVVINDEPDAMLLEELDVDEESMELATRFAGDLRKTFRELLGPATESAKLVGANTAFDLSVATKEDPSLYPDVFTAITQGRVSDIFVREKLLNLAQHGSIDYVDAPSGKPMKVEFSLESLAKHYLAAQIEGKTKTNKKGEIVEGEDAWRINYDVLEDMPLEEWPDEAIEYSMRDAAYPTLIWRHQEKRRRDLQHDLGLDPLKTESFRVLIWFCLYLCSDHGVLLDPEEHGKIVAELAEALKPENLNLLVGAEILRPGSPPRPHARGAKIHVEGCKKKGCDCPPKMTKGKKPSINKKKLIAHVEAVAKKHGLTLAETETGGVSVNKDWLAENAKFCPILLQYQNRQTYQKLVTTDLPRMEWPKGSGTPARVLHASFDFLKETGRTSSYASKAYPSWNCQNPHPRVRAAVVARPGYVLYSVDYSSMELGTLAQKCYNLFGFSVLRDVINKGWDAHAYLGAYLAFFLDDLFHESVIDECGSNPTGDMLYQAFVACKKSDDEAVRAFFKHYRTFAKPTGLGYPGGLGPETFVNYAYGTYGVEVDEDTAAELREVWHKTFPEMKRYLNWISESCPDPMHPGKYAYVSPLGLYRAGAGFCPAANGAGLQTPSAEGALLALCTVQEKTFADIGSPLYTDPSSTEDPRHRLSMFLHDELIGEVRVDCAHECAMEVSRIMVECMEQVTPDVRAKAAPVLMWRWDKRAEPRFDDNGRLIPWTPE